MFKHSFSLIRNFVADRNSSGAVALVGNRDGIVAKEAFGYTDFSNKTPVDFSSLFDVASLTKVVVTTTITLQLVEEGIIRLDDSLEFFYPHTPPDKSRITIRQLLSHASGLPAWARLCTTRKPTEVVEEIFELPLSSSPGTKIEYSCVGFILLGRIIENLTNQGLDRVAHQRIFTPLEMKDSYFNPQADPNRIVATEWVADYERCLCGEVHDENARSLAGVSGNAGLFSTALDLARFSQMMLNRGSLDSRAILGQATFDLLAQYSTASLGEPRTLGWLLPSTTHCSGGDLLLPFSLGHTGFTGTSIWIDFRREVFFILLTNRVHPSRENTKIIRLRPLFHNLALSEYLANQA